MPRYEVLIKKTEIYRFEIEADSKSEALDNVYDSMEQLTKEEKQEKHWHDSDSDDSVEKLD